MTCLLVDDATLFENLRLTADLIGKAIVQRLCRTYNLKDGKQCLTFRQ